MKTRASAGTSGRNHTAKMGPPQLAVQEDVARSKEQAFATDAMDILAKWIVRSRIPKPAGQERRAA